MDDYGYPTSYLVLAPGTPVYASEGEHVGSVARVMYVAEKDIFDGIVCHTKHGKRFVDAPEVGAIYERAVILTISSAEVAQLPEH